MTGNEYKMYNKIEIKNVQSTKVMKMRKDAEA